MSLISSLARFARSPQGRRTFGQAKRYAQSPQGRAKIDQVRRQIATRGSATRKRPPR
jgi:hypothetical protein